MIVGFTKTPNYNRVSYTTEDSMMDNRKFIKELLMLSDETLFKIGHTGMTGEGRAVAEAYVQGAQVEHLGCSGAWELRTCPAFMSSPEKYRARKGMIRVNGVEVPAPESKAPDVGEKCCVPKMPGIYRFPWEGTIDEHAMLSLGLVYLDAHDCRLRADAMLRYEWV